MIELNEPPATTAGGSYPRLVSRSGDKRGRSMRDEREKDRKEEAPAARRSGRKSSRPHFRSEECVDKDAATPCFQRQDVMELCPEDGLLSFMPII